MTGTAYKGRSSDFQLLLLQLLMLRTSSGLKSLLRYLKCIGFRPPAPPRLASLFAAGCGGVGFGSITPDRVAKKSVMQLGFEAAATRPLALCACLCAAWSGKGGCGAPTPPAESATCFCAAAARMRFLGPIAETPSC